MAAGYRYPGTKPFSTEDERIFYGRKQDVDKLYQLISLKNMLIFYSQSGMGKSSLIKAGLIPRFRNEKKEAILPVIIRFGANGAGCQKMAENLVGIIIKELSIEAEKLADKKLPFASEEETYASLWCMVKLFERNNTGLLLVFDQAEEIFTYDKEELNQLKEEIYLLFNRAIPNFLHKRVQALLDDLENTSNEDSLDASMKAADMDTLNTDIEFIYRPIGSKILFAVKEDKLGQFNVFNDYFPDILKDTYKLLPLTESNASEAITGPGQSQGDFLSNPFTYSPEALSKLLNALREEDATFDPFSIQLNCRYIEMNKVVGEGKSIIEESDIPDEGKIVKDYYDNLWKSIPGSKEDIEKYKKEIEEKLIDVNKETRKYVYEKDLGEIGNIINLLISNGLIREDPRGEDRYIELSHDRLIKPMIESSRRRMVEENAKKEYEQQLLAANQRRKKVQARIITGILVLLVAIITAVWFELRSDREIEIQQAYWSVNKANPTIAYNIALMGKANGFGSFNNLLMKADSAKLGYLTTAFAVPDKTLGAYFSADNRQVVVVGESEIKYFNRRGMIDSSRFFEGNIVYSTFNQGKGFLIIQKVIKLAAPSGSDSFELKSFSGNTINKFTLSSDHGNFQLSANGKSLLIGTEVYSTNKKIQQVGQSAGSTYISAVCFAPDEKSTIKGYSSGYVTDGQNSVQTGFSPVTSIQAINDSVILVISQDNSLTFIGVKNKENDASESGFYNRMSVIGKVRGESIGLITNTGICPTAEKVVVASDDRQARVYATNGTRIATLKGHTSKIVSAGFSSSGKEMVTASSNGEVFIWQLEKPSVLHSKGALRPLSPLDYLIFKLNKKAPETNGSFTDKLNNLVADNVSYISQYYSDIEEDKYDYSIGAIMNAEFEAILHSPDIKQLGMARKRLITANYGKILSLQLEKADQNNPGIYNNLLDRKDSLDISSILYDTLDYQKALQFNSTFDFYITELRKSSDYGQIVKYSNKKVGLLSGFYAKDSTFPGIKVALVNSYGGLAYYLCFLKQYTESVVNTKKAIALDPKSNWLYTNLALAKLLAGRYEEAEAVYRTFKDKPSELGSESVRQDFLSDLRDFTDYGIISPDNKVLWEKASYIKENILNK